jgi:hypothetical protein
VFLRNIQNRADYCQPSVSINSSSPSSPTTLSSLISSFPIEQSVKVAATAKIILIAIPLASVAAVYLFNTIATTTFVIGMVFWLRY